MNASKHILLLVGGASAEREISKRSSRAIYAALTELGYKVSLLDPAYGTNQPTNIEDFFSVNDISEVSAGNYLAALSLPVMKEIDTVFIGLHGQYGEDGMIQSLLELQNISYTGSGILASSLAMDKHMAKIIMKDHGINCPKEIFIRKNSVDMNDILRRIADDILLPCVVKPNDQGSTCGLTVCNNLSEVQAAVELALSMSVSGTVLIEEFIKGRELTAGVIGNQTLPVLEIRPTHGLYDYECKYTSGMTEYIVPAEIDSDTSNLINQMTQASFVSLGCKTYGRADFRLTPDGQVYCLEMNTLPGMTSTSLLPKMAKAVGISFNELIDRIVKDSF